VIAASSPVVPGDVVDIAGYPALSEAGAVLTEATIKATGERTLLHPRAVRAEQIMDGEFDNRLVELDAPVLSVSSGLTQQIVTLQSGKTAFVAQLDDRIPPAEIRAGSIVRVTGIAVVARERSWYRHNVLVPSSFRIQMRSAEDLNLLRAATWWNLDHILPIFGLLVVSICLVMLWVAALRRRVKVQTRELALAADKKGLTLSCNIDPGIPQVICGDPNRLRQVLLNLTSNAVKFTANGSVAITVKALSSGIDGHELQFTVADTGIGIPKNLQDSIFSPFTQADTSTTRKFGGTGLGLTICRRLVSMFGGTIWLDSEPGLGSQFHFTGRFGAVEQPERADLNDDGVLGLLERPHAATQSFRKSEGLDILVAEDNSVNQLVMKRLLHKRGHRVTFVADGRSAIAAVFRERFDVVFMDVQMPVLDGLEATREIRQAEAANHGSHVPIIALTAHAMQGDKQRCLEAGMDGYLTKPINPDELDRLLGMHAASVLEAVDSPALR
jgi:CheY-like chemotaxis protein